MEQFPEILNGYLGPTPFHQQTGLFEKFKVLSREELHSRYDIYIEEYSKHINIEAQTAMQMVRRQYLPAVIRYVTELSNAAKAAGDNASVQKELLAEVTVLLASVGKKLKKLAKETAKAQAIKDVTQQAALFRDQVATALAALRTDIDAIEAIAE